MAIKKVLVTYDFTDEKYHNNFRKKEPGLGPWVHKGNIARNHYDQSLFGQLQSLGVDVKMLSHEAGESINGRVDSLERELENSDLVFHDSYRINLEVIDSTWKEEYLKAIDNLVHDKALERSEFSGLAKPYTHKDKATKIARDIGLPVPRTWTVDEYFDSDRPLPVMLKDHDSAGGYGIFFIDKAEQLDTFFNEGLYESHLDTPGHECYGIQSFIPTPSNHFTHFRIFTMGDGNIIGAVMSASGIQKDTLERAAQPGPFRVGKDMYDCVDSPTYLGCYNVVSNHNKGGSQIPFDANGRSKPLTENDKEIVIAHGYDPKNLSLDPKLKELSEKAAAEFSKFGVLYSGQDWMQDQEGNFHFIEINPGPGMEIFNTLYNKGEGDLDTADKIGTLKLAEAFANYQL